MTVVTARPRRSAPGSYVRELWKRREFAWFLAIGNLQARNASTALGLFWWVLNPLLLAAVYFVVFGFIFQARNQHDDYLSYLISGIFAFTYTSTSMTTGANSILANSKLLANVKFPRLILPISAVIEAGVGFLAALSIFYLVAIPANQVYPTVAVLLLIPTVALHTFFNLGLGAMTARLAVPFRDVNNLIPYILRLWLYLSPIIWPLSLLDSMPSWAQTAVKLNPLFSFLSLYRSALLGGPVEWSMLGAAFVWTMVFLTSGIYLFVRYEGHMVRHL